MKKIGDYIFLQAAFLVILIALTPMKASADRIDELIASSEEGSQFASMEIARMYRTGDGVARDMEQAVYYLRRASEDNHTGATFDLAMILKNGDGVQADLAEAHQLLNSVATRFWALYELGHMYEQGLGVPKDTSKAERLYCRAAVDYFETKRYSSRYYDYVPPNSAFVPGEDYGVFLYATCAQEIGLQAAAKQELRDKIGRDMAFKAIPWGFLNITALSIAVVGFWFGLRRRKYENLENKTLWMLSCPSIYILLLVAYLLVFSQVNMAGDTYLNSLFAYIAFGLLALVGMPLAMFPINSYRRRRRNL